MTVTLRLIKAAEERRKASLYSALLSTWILSLAFVLALVLGVVLSLE